MGSRVIQLAAPNYPPVAEPPQFTDRIFTFSRDISVNSQSWMGPIAPASAIYASTSWSGHFALKGNDTWTVNTHGYSQDRAWAIQIDGPTVLACSYDPISRTLKVIMQRPNTYFILTGMSYSVTNAIEAASNQEAYVLALLGH